MLTIRRKAQLGLGAAITLFALSFTAIAVRVSADRDAFRAPSLDVTTPPSPQASAGADEGRYNPFPRPSTWRDDVAVRLPAQPAAHVQSQPRARDLPNLEG